MRDSILKRNVRRFVSVAISALTVGVTFFLQFTVFGVNSAFDWAEFMPQFAVNMFLLVTTAVLWINSGTERAKNEECSPYRDNSVLYAGQIKKITDGGRLGELRAFCKLKTEELLQNKISSLLANVGIDRKVYDDTLKSLSVTELKKDGYVRRQIVVIERIRGDRVHVKPIRYMDLLSDSVARDDYGVNYNERADKAVRVTSRAIRSAVMSVMLALISIDIIRDIGNMQTWVMFFMRLFTIVWTAYGAEHEGYTRITDVKNKVTLRRIAFLYEFEEWAKVPRLISGTVPFDE